MKIILFRHLLLAFCILVSMSTVACGTKYNIKGRVVDAATNKPIEGASIAIDWTGQELEHYIAPYASGEYSLEKTKTRSDKDGYFILPKYPIAKSVDMVVYKIGYVCWDLKNIFQKGQRDIYEVKGMTKKREKIDIEDGITIRLEPFTDEYHKPTHALFVKSVSWSPGGRMLEGIEEELKLYYKYYRNKKRGEK